MGSTEWIGKKLSNRYLIEELLGQGGMSAVYKATDPNLKRVVAIKMIHSHLSSEPDFVQRFEEEASAVAQLRHPGIIQVFDFNKQGDDYYMVMEFVPGETFQQHLQRLSEEGRQLPIEKIVEYMASICDAVEYAHRRGMIHRDIKPANVMLSVNDQAILTDFGIAKIVGSQRHTATGAVVGTALYMSPEQIRSERVDHRTDIYSLGVMLFEMISGRPPFQADSALTLMMMHISNPVPDPKKLNPRVPDELVAVVNKALAKNPNNRYQSAAEMAAALRQISARFGGIPIAPVPPDATMVEKTPRPTPAPDATIHEEPRVPSSAPEAIESTVVESATRPSLGTTGSTGAAAAGAVESPMVTPARARAAEKPKLAWPMLVGGAVLFAVLLFGGIFFVNTFLNQGNSPATEPFIAPIADVLETATETPAPENTSTGEATLAPTLTPTITTTPTETVPPGIPFVRITSITIDDQQRYVVDYETFEFTEVLPGVHVHFFFDTVPPENAGSPGTGPWFLYGGPRPFTGYRVTDRPAEAQRMCVLVANANHSVQPSSGNCVDLP